MENFVVSARKYRPSTFDTVVGQQSITGTLKNAIKNNHLAQAFLFCGPRGVGKTSCARILAKTINCFDPTDNVEACNKCESCKGFNENHSFNIHELDAASNNGVDKIRELVDQVRFAPQVGKYNIYIIDEVHMLSQAAFNAFLKTLEEPPAHAIFILATTEKHKIIPTILSRCQIFDFKRIQIEDIAKHLQFVAKSENIEAQEDALHIIAQKSDGALRDSLSIFDQIVSFSGNKLDYNSVIENLNILDYDYFFKATDAILDHNIPKSLHIFNEILNNGFDGQNYINGLAQHFRDLLVCKDASTLQLLEVGNNIKEKYQEQSQKCSNDFLLHCLNTCSTTDINYKMSKNQRLLVELNLMKMCGYGLDQNTEAEKKTFNVKLSPSKETIKPENPVTAPIKPVIEQKKETIVENVVQEITASTPKKVTVATTTTRKSRTISMNPFAQKDEDKKDASDELEIKNEQAFTQEDVTKCWADFYTKMEPTGKHNFLGIIKSKIGKLKSENTIEVTLDNKVQEEVFKEEYFDLLRFLKTNLLNDKINLITQIKKLDQSEIRAYTAEDKFKKMADKNDSLIKLREHFNLEIDY